MRHQLLLAVARMRLQGASAAKHKGWMMCRTSYGMWLGAGVFGTAVLCAQAQPLPDLEQRNQEQLRRAQERQTQLRSQQERSPEVRLQPPVTAPEGLLPQGEQPCFPIHLLQLAGDDEPRFEWLLAHAQRTTAGVPDPIAGRCLGAKGVQMVVDRLQAALIAQGLVTTRVLAAPQDLKSGTLMLTLVPGRVNALRWSQGSGSRGSWWNTVPITQGEVLNLRDIEQALENFKRVPTAEADIQITPATAPGYSDLVVTHRQGFPFRLSAGVDDSGTRSTGKYQGHLTLNHDNWWTASDLFYLMVTHDLGGSEPQARGTKGHTLHYSLPLGYGLLALTSSSNNYHQTVAGANQDYVYSGTSDTTDIKYSQVIARDSVSTTQTGLKGFQRKSRNYIDDTEVMVQRRVVGGLEWSLGHKRGIDQGKLEANLVYRLGTGAWGSLPAPEEAFGEGTSRMRLWQADASLQWPFKLQERAWTYSGQLRGQLHKTRLTPQDKFAIGGRFTVRGFDGLNVLSAESGLLWRNEWSTALTSGLQTFVGVDHGQVWGPSAANLVGHHLTGAVLGLRGQAGAWQYEAFVGKPISKPEHFKTASVTAGFSLNVSF